MIKKILCFSIALLLIFSLAACVKETEEDAGLRAGFETNGDEPAPPILVRFTSDKSRLKVGEDLTIKLYYIPNSNYDTAYDPASISISAKINMGHSIYGDLCPWGGSYSSELIEQFVLKDIENFFDQEYTPKYFSDVGWFSGTETIVIPAEWFAGERGSIGWWLIAHIDFPEDSVQEDFSESGGVALNYRVEGENIILYDSYYKFFNDIRN